MTLLLRFSGALALMAAGIACAAAHPVHGTGLPEGLLHPLEGLDHLLAALAVGMWAARIGGRALWTLPTGFIVAMLLGCIAALAGYGPSAVEPMIAASVAVLGLILLFRFGSNAAVATALVSYFAVFHGMAHAAELDHTAVLFIAGLLGATAALHGIGIIAARRLPKLIPVAGAGLAAAGAWWVAASVV